MIEFSGELIQAPFRKPDIPPDTISTCMNSNGLDPYRESPHDAINLSKSPDFKLIVCCRCGAMWREEVSYYEEIKIIGEAS